MQTSTKKNLLIAACYAGTVVLGMIIGPKFSKENDNSRNGTFIPFLPGGRADKVDRVLNIIEENYVDPVEADTMADLAINQILKKLDPHSSYLSPSEAKRFSEDLDGNYNGIGIEYQLLNDTVFVTGVHEGGPAAVAGVLPGDKILRVDGTAVTGKQASEKHVVALIKGKRGSNVMLDIDRQGEPKKIAVRRDKIVISSIDVAYMLDKTIAYIKISKFGARTNEDFSKAVRQLKDQGMKDLVLDLRGNGGGYLNSATALADEFLPGKKLIVYTKGQHEPRTDYFSTDKGVFEKGKLAILIDENSASASEILAGAIQDLDRGVIVGRRSFGKGLVQEQFNFGDGSALNLTVARYFTPSGRSIQKPYKDEGSDKYFGEVAERFKNGEVSGKHADTLIKNHKRFKTSNGRAIYDGGGISPDIFVPLDTLAKNAFYYHLNARGLLNEWVYRYLSPGLKPSSLPGFLRNFKVDDGQYQQLLKLASNNKVKFSQSQAEAARPALTRQIKAITARYYFGDKGYYHAKNSGDKVITRALDTLFKAP